MIQYRNVYTIYDNKFEAINGVDLHIKNGEFVSLIGPNGAGKSTLLRLLTKEIQPSQGDVLVEGINIAEVPDRDLPVLRRKVGTIFQDFKLLGNKTAFENVAFALEVCGASNQEIEDDVPKVLHIVGLANKMDNFPNQLSGGERQRVAIARALIHRPTILLADEPTGNLDLVNSYDVVKLLSKINELGTTVILATHNREVVNSIGRRVVSMENGKIVRDQIAEGKYII